MQADAEEARLLSDEAVRLMVEADSPDDAVEDCRRLLEDRAARKAESASLRAEVARPDHGMRPTVRRPRVRPALRRRRGGGVRSSP